MRCGPHGDFGAAESKHGRHREASVANAWRGLALRGRTGFAQGLHTTEPTHHVIDDGSRGIGPAVIARRTRHGLALGGVVQQLFDQRAQRIDLQLRLSNTNRPALLFERFRVLGLVVIGSKREWNQYRRTPDRAELGERRGTCPGND